MVIYVVGFDWLDVALLTGQTNEEDPLFIENRADYA
jgi:hypothetical protein